MDWDRDQEPWLDISSNQAAEEIHDRMVEGVPIVPTGVPSVDKAMRLWGDGRGMPRGTYCIIGGASNIGKTQAGLYLAKQAAEQGEKAAILSLDMKRRDAIARLHQALTIGKIDWQDWMPSRWKADYEHILKDALREFRVGVSGSIGIHTGGGKTLEWVETLIREAHEIGATFFVVDHMQKIKVPGVGGDNIAGRAEVVSERMDDLCDELDITIVALSQLNRFASRDREKRPTMADLWGGTAMESNAAVIIMLDHSRYQRDPVHHHIGRSYWILDKNQFGPKGFEVPVEVNHATLGFREALPHEEHEWPKAKASR